MSGSLPIPCQQTGSITEPSQLEPIAASIADYALIDDCRTAALVLRDGSIGWLCLPKLSSRPIFATPLDAEGGSFSLSPTWLFATTRRCVDGTAILQTMFPTSTGSACILDYLPVLGGIRQIRPMRELLRIVEGGTGTISVEAAMDAVSLMLGVAVRLAGAVGVLFILNLSIEWSWNCFGIYVLGILAVVQALRYFGLDHLLAKHLIPGSFRGDGFLACTLAVAS